VIGEACAFGSAVCFAVSNVTITRGAAKGAADNGAFLSLLITVGISGAIWIAVSLHAGFPQLSLEGLLWLAAAGVFTAFIGRVLLYASIQRLGAVRASAIKRLNPFFAVLLGVTVLGEAITGSMALGLALIVGSFLLLIHAQLRTGAAEPGAPRASWWRQWLNLGYLYGPVSALGYAVGYLMRKTGLHVTPDPYLGTLVGTLTGALLFLLAAGVSPSYQRAVAGTFQRPNPWLYAAGIASSFGQILYFAALNVSTMSRVALLASMEVFVTLLLSLLFLREKLSPQIAVAALLGVAGTVALVGG
jgi:drug/metabolite transporter (DMT)-like permease